jgi:hypothetical protein
MLGGREHMRVVQAERFGLGHAIATTSQSPTLPHSGL